MKAVVIGGSSGIGLGCAIHLREQGYHVAILSRHPPDLEYPPHTGWEHIPFDCREPDLELLERLAEDRDVTLLLITAGLGRVADFQYFHPSEIRTCLQVNTTAALQALRVFYERLVLPRERFACGVVSSISGLLPSPAAAVYAASKAALCRFIESVNIELEVSGSPNRILNIAPSAIQGTRFYGGENDLEAIRPLAEEIVKRCLAGETLYIPGYESGLKAVLERCGQDPHAFALESYQYKRNSQRMKNEAKAVIGYLSGTFDLFHIGHLNLLRRAKEQCDYLIVGVHESGAWKGKETFIPYQERREIVASCRYVDRAVPSTPEDSDAWALWHYHRLFVGGDYVGSERFARYEAFFQGKDVKIVYFPYTKSTSSTQIRKIITLETEGKKPPLKGEVAAPQGADGGV